MLLDKWHLGHESKDIHAILELVISYIAERIVAPLPLLPTREELPHPSSPAG
jgi:hypothetical protein